MWGIPLIALALLVGCGDDASGGGGSMSSSSGSGAGGAGGAGGGAASCTDSAALETILDELRADLDSAMLAHAAESGWPVPLGDCHLFVSTDPSLDRVAGDHDDWAGTPMNQETGFQWSVLQVSPGSRYKFTNLTEWLADPWARSTTYDDFGEMSLVEPPEAHLDRYFRIGDAAMEPRTLRVWVPVEAIDRVLYVHDGQNLFDPAANWGGWHLQEQAPPGMLIVGIDNTPARLDEYTHVPDQIDDSGDWYGGEGDAYADFLQQTVRPFIQGRYGEPGPIGVMGSSLGGVISVHIADRYPGEYAFAASLSGTMGWGSIGAAVQNETMIARYAAHTQPMAVLYLDSGGGPGSGCVDSDGDGTEDDSPDAGDNYCENAQMLGVLTGAQGAYTLDTDLFYVWDEGAEHNEVSWAARVEVPLGIFEGL